MMWQPVLVPTCYGKQEQVMGEKGTYREKGLAVLILNVHVGALNIAMNPYFSVWITSWF